jgi:prepilin-type N-terminal cleavage/methylation domain-containing protein
VIDLPIKKTILQSQRGFSLLEMIAALTILAIGSGALFSWLGQTTGQLARFQVQEKASIARLQAIDFLSAQNPAVVGNGKQAFDGFSIEWKGEPVAEVRDSISPSGGLGLYQVSLYEVQVSTFDRSGQPWFEFPVKLVGYKQVRQPPKETPF